MSFGHINDGHRFLYRTIVRPLVQALCIGSMSFGLARNIDNSSSTAEARKSNHDHGHPARPGKEGKTPYILFPCFWPLLYVCTYAAVYA